MLPEKNIRGQKKNVGKMGKMGTDLFFKFGGRIKGVRTILFFIFQQKIRTCHLGRLTLLRSRIF